MVTFFALGILKVRSNRTPTTYAICCEFVVLAKPPQSEPCFTPLHKWALKERDRRRAQEEANENAKLLGEENTVSLYEKTPESQGQLMQEPSNQQPAAVRQEVISQSPAFFPMVAVPTSNRGTGMTIAMPMSTFTGQG